MQHGATVAAVAARCNGALYREPVAPHHRARGTGSTTTIKALERAALDGHHRGQSWQAYFAANAGTIADLAAHDPGGWAGTSERLLHVLTTGDTSGRLAAGDDEADEAPAVVVPTISDTETRARLLWPPEVSA